MSSIRSTIEQFSFIFFSRCLTSTSTYTLWEEFKSLCWIYLSFILTKFLTLETKSHGLTIACLSLNKQHASIQNYPAVQLNRIFKKTVQQEMTTYIITAKLFTLHSSETPRTIYESLYPDISTVFVDISGVLKLLNELDVSKTTGPCRLNSRPFSETVQC